MLEDFPGPLGSLGPDLRRRRIAVALGADGCPVLVRPDSVIVDVGDGGDVDSVIRSAERQGFELLSNRGDGALPTRLVGVRQGHAQRPAARPERWRLDVARRMLDQLGERWGDVAFHRVYLTDGVARHFGRLSDTGSSGTPGRSAPPTTTTSAAQPAPPPAALRPRLALPGRERPHVLVLDTGLATSHRRAAHPELREQCLIPRGWRDSRTPGRWDDEDEPDDDGGGVLDDQAGHGTFVSGIVRQACPDAVIHHRGVLTSYGDGDDVSIDCAVALALAQRRYDLVVAAFGGYADDDGSVPMAGAIRRLQATGALVVSSAGNDATSRPSYPAALPGVLAVGGLDEDGRALFSNFGAWVDCCAPATDLVSTFFTSFDETGAAGRFPRSFRGWARWSGSSFAAPYVAGVIAQEMYRYGGTAHDAWARLRARSTTRVPDLGLVITG
ncbi:MAG: S8 family peptidase [Desertimonas sp.]